MMRSYQKSIKLFVLRLKIKKLENQNQIRLENIKLNALLVYDDRYIKTKIRTYSDKVYTNSRDLNMLEDDIECESFTVISIDSLLMYDKKYYFQVYLDNQAYKTVKKQMTGYLDENLFGDQIL